jgi:peptidoglycan/LPS O-acetylase OafA/YrhL
MKINKQTSNLLNFIRWVSALLVVIGHLRSFLFVKYSKVLHHTIFTKFFYFITGFGHQAVIAFFVLSGFLVGGGLISKYRKKVLNNYELNKYFIKRFVRIYIVLIPALIIGYILDKIGVNLFKDLYNNIYHISAMNYNVLKRLDILTFAGNTLNLQTLLVEPLGTNGPLWSLANEWWYYILFPLMIIRRFRIFAFFLIIIFSCLNFKHVLYILIWVIGAMLVFVNKPILNKYLAFLIFLIVLIISRKFSGIFMDFLLAMSLFLLINSYIFTGNKVFFENLNTFMADFSYSLYLFHFPFLVFLISFLHFMNIKLLLQQFTLNVFIIYFIILILIYIYAYVMFLFFESKTKKIYTFIEKE